MTAINTKPYNIDLRYILRSDYKGFWLRLKSLGFLPHKMWTKPKVFNGRDLIISCFSFKKNTLVIRLMMAKSYSRFVAYKNNKIVYDSKPQPCFSWLEQPFLYFLKDKRPLTCLKTFERLTQKEILKRQARPKKKTTT